MLAGCGRPCSQAVAGLTGTRAARAASRRAAAAVPGRPHAGPGSLMSNSGQGTFMDPSRAPAGRSKPQPFTAGAQHGVPTISSIRLESLAQGRWAMKDLIGGAGKAARVGSARSSEMPAQFQCLRRAAPPRAGFGRLRRPVASRGTEVSVSWRSCSWVQPRARPCEPACMFLRFAPDRTSSPRVLSLVRTEHGASLAK